MKSKNLDFELNLLPIISLLAVCISFLLLTAVWIPVGGMGIKQSVGEDTMAKVSPKDLSLWVKFDGNQNLTLFIRDADMNNIGTTKKINMISVKNLDHTFKKWLTSNPKVKNAIIAPDSNTSLNSIVQIMDIVRGSSVDDIGVAPI